MDTVLKMAGEATLQLGFVVLMVVFISGIITTNMLWDASDPEVREKFAYLGRSMWTMYSLMTMDNWTEQVMQIMQTKPGMFLFFILYIFVAAITLMSLTPAIFVQLNMHRREQEAEARILHKKEEFIKRHANMMDELFKMTDTNHNEMISMNEMKQLIMDKPKMGTLKDKSVLEEGMLRTVMLSIFDFWDESSFEYSEKSHEFSRKEFTQHIIDRLADPHADLLFCGVATRKMVHDLSTQAIENQEQVRKKLDKMDEAFRSEMERLRRVVQAKEGYFSPEAEREDEVARASSNASRQYRHGQGSHAVRTRSRSQDELRHDNLRSQEENHAPSKEEKQQEVRLLAHRISPLLQPGLNQRNEAILSPQTTFLEAETLTTDKEEGGGRLAGSGGLAATATKLIQERRHDKVQQGDLNSGSAWDHPFQGRPQSTDSNPFLQKKKSASELSATSNTDRSESELFGQAEWAPMVSGTKWERPKTSHSPDRALASQTRGESRESVQNDRPASYMRHTAENEAKGSVRQLQVAPQRRQEEERRGQANMPSGWRNFYAGGTRPQGDSFGTSRESRSDSFGSASFTGGNSKGCDAKLREPAVQKPEGPAIQDVLTTLDNFNDGNRSSANRETAVSPHPATTGSLSPTPWQKRQRQQPQPQRQQQDQQTQQYGQGRDPNEVTDDAQRIRPPNPPWNNGRNIPPPWSSTTSSTSSLTPATPGSVLPIQADSNNAGPRYWDDDEVKGWIRVTMRMSARFQTVQDRTSFLFRRWEEAKPHFLPDQLKDMEQLLHELVDSWGQPRIENQGSAG